MEQEHQQVRMTKELRWVEVQQLQPVVLLLGKKQPTHLVSLE
jgi:hypothetical protein